MKKWILFAAIFCSCNAFSLPILYANPILKADREQLEEWRVGPENINIPPKALERTLTEYDGGIVWRLQSKAKLKITLEEFLSPATKMHIKKEYGLEITEEDKALATKKWSDNPLLEVDAATLKRWLKGSACKHAYTDPSQTNFKEYNGNMHWCVSTSIPKIMLDTGVRPAQETFIDPKVIDKAREVFK